MKIELHAKFFFKIDLMGRFFHSNGFVSNSDRKLKPVTDNFGPIFSWEGGIIGNKWNGLKLWTMSQSNFWRFKWNETGDISTEKVDYYVAANFKTIAKVKITETVAATIFLTHY